MAVYQEWNSMDPVAVEDETRSQAWPLVERKQNRGFLEIENLAPLDKRDG